MDLDQLEKTLEKQNLQDIFVGVVLMIIIIYMKPFIFENIFEYNDNFVSPSHYTVIIKNLPDDTTKQELKQYFQDLTKDKVVNVNFAYDLSDYTESFNEKIKVLKAMRECQNGLEVPGMEENDKIEYDRLRRDLMIHRNSLKILNERLNNFKDDCQNPRSSKFLGTAFISFQHQMPVRCIVEEWGINSLRQLQYWICGCYRSPYMKFKDKYMMIEQPGAPTDVIWENLEFNVIKIIISNLVMIFGSVLLLSGSFSFQFFVMKYVYPYKKEGLENSDIVIKLLAVILSLIVVIINVALRLLVFQFTKLIKFDSITKFYSAYINRYIFLYFANSAFIPYLVHGIFDPKDDNRLLVQDIHFIMLASSFSTPLSKIFEIDVFLKVIQRRLLNRYSPKKCPYTQHEANEIFEDYMIDIADSYAFISRTLFLSAWYAAVAPMGIIFGLCGMLLNYWVDKYQLLRMQSQPQSINEKVIRQVINLLELVPILYILGSLQYESKLANSSNVIEFIIEFMEYGISNVFLAVAFITFFVFARQKVPKNKLDKFSYESVRLNFRTEYDACNPITKQEANKDWIKYLYKQKIITKKEKNLLIKQGEQQIMNKKSYPILMQKIMGGRHTPVNTPRVLTEQNFCSEEESQIMEEDLTKKLSQYVIPEEEKQNKEDNFQYFEMKEISRENSKVSSITPKNTKRSLIKTAEDNITYSNENTNENNL